MYRIEGLLRVVAKFNTDPDLYCFYLDPAKQTAIAGYRRLYGCGDCLVRVAVDNLDMKNLPHVPGVYHYVDNNFSAEHFGLPGRDLANGTREVVDLELAARDFEEVYTSITSAPPDEQFSVLLNPKMICDFIEEQTAHNGFDDRKINIQIFDGVNASGLFPGRGMTLPGGIPAIEMRSNVSATGLEAAMIDAEHSLIPPTRVRDGQLYICQAVSRTDQGPVVKVMREFKRGIRFTVQYLRSGMKMPSHPQYSPYEEPGNKITSANILDLPFIEGQEGQFHKAPLLTIDLDTLYRALKPMVMYEVAKMIFRDSVTGIIIQGMAKPGQERVDAIIGPTSPFKHGKVYTR